MEISDWAVWGYLPVLITLALVWRQGILFAQNPELKTGKEIFQAACIACHGPDDPAGNFPNAVVAAVGNVKIACRIYGDSVWTVERRARGRTTIA